MLVPGYGDRPEVFRDQLSLIDPDGHWYVVIAHPPVDGPHGPMWYPGDHDGPGHDQIADAVASLDATVDLVATEAGLARRQVVLVGHSQGGAVALATTLDPSAGPSVRAVGVLAGFLANRPDDALDLDRVRHTPLLFVHSPDDPTIDLLRGRSAAKALGRAGADVTFVEVTGEHRLGPELAAPLGGWLAQLADI